MKIIRLITGVLTLSLIAASFAGCGEKAETQDFSAMKQEQGQGKEQAQGRKATQGQRGIMAKVVSLDGDRLTVILADMPDRGGEGQTPPPDNTAKTNGGNPPAPPSGTDGPASGPAINGTGQPGQPGAPGEPGEGGRKIEFTGGEATYTLSGDVAVMKGLGDGAAEIDLSELKADDVIRFTARTDDNGDEAIDTIILME